jgi:hypothetical protein
MPTERAEMANHKGSEGAVKIGSNTVAELKSYSINHTTNTIEDTTLTDSSKTFQAGSSQFDGSAECFWDETDTAQISLTAGAQVTLYIYPEGSTSGDTVYSGTAIVTGITRSATVDGMVEVSFSFQGTGDLSTATV